MEPIDTPLDSHTATNVDTNVDSALEQERRRTLQDRIRTRHALALHELMSEREDLHGVHALADQISESLRWSA